MRIGSYRLVARKVTRKLIPHPPHASPRVITLEWNMPKHRSTCSGNPKSFCSSAARSTSARRFLCRIKTLKPSAVRLRGNPERIQKICRLVAGACCGVSQDRSTWDCGKRSQLQVEIDQAVQSEDFCWIQSARYLRRSVAQGSGRRSFLLFPSSTFHSSRWFTSSGF